MTWSTRGASARPGPSSSLIVRRRWPTRSRRTAGWSARRGRRRPGRAPGGPATRRCSSLPSPASSSPLLPVMSTPRAFASTPNQASVVSCVEVERVRVAAAPSRAGSRRPRSWRAPGSRGGPGVSTGAVTCGLRGVRAAGALAAGGPLATGPWTVGTALGARETSAVTADGAALGGRSSVRRRLGDTDRRPGGGGVGVGVDRWRRGGAGLRAGERRRAGLQDRRSADGDGERLGAGLD